MISHYVSLCTVICFLFRQTTSLPTSLNLEPRYASPSVYVAGPKITTDFPDPCIIKANNKWYSFATATFANNHTVNIQAAESDDFITWHIVTSPDGNNYDALPTPGAWVSPTAPNTWAPDVAELSDGSYVLYYAGATTIDTTKHCVGSATSPVIHGPYTAMATPLACPLSQGGAIDISSFHDPSTGQRYVLYKVDGNSLGHGEECGNTVAAIVPTPIMLQAVCADGVTLQGEAVQILDNDGVSDDGIVEAPSLIRSENGQYVLFFSSGCYSTPDYNVNYAVSSNGIQGPYVRKGPLQQTGDDGLYAPGGADATQDGHVVFHADLGTSAAVRQMYVGKLQVLKNGTVVI